MEEPWDPDYPPVYTVACPAERCEAEGCPRTASGFPEGFDLSRHQRFA